MKAYLLLFLFVFQGLFSFSQLITDWERNTDIELMASNGTMLTDSQGNLIMVRGISYYGSSNGDYAITKYTSTGTKLWQIVDQDAFDDFAFNVHDWTIDSEDNIILVGDQFNGNMYYRRS